MNTLSKLHYHCLVDPSDNSVVSQGETVLGDISPLEVGNRVIKKWGLGQFDSIKNGEARVLDYFYATDLIRPHRSVATFAKGEFVAVRSVMGSKYPGHEEHYNYEYGYEECRPASYEEFPLPSEAPHYLRKENFYDEAAIKVALAACIDELKVAISSEFPGESIKRLLSLTEVLIASAGGQGLHPHPVPLFGPNEEDSAILILDLVIFAVLERGADFLRDDVIDAHEKRLASSSVEEYQLRDLLSSMKS